MLGGAWLRPLDCSNDTAAHRPLAGHEFALRTAKRHSSMQIFCGKANFFRGARTHNL